MRELRRKRHDERRHVFRDEALVVRRVAMQHLLHPGDLGRGLRRRRALMPRHEHRHVTAHLAGRGHGVRDSRLQLLAIVIRYH